MTLFGRLKSVVHDAAELTEIPNVRNFVARLEPANPTTDQSFELVKGDAFAPERSYFSVRLAEMRLSQASKYGLEFLPMCCCFLRYSYGSVQRHVPYVLGHETISSGLGDTAVSANTSRRITFQDMYVVRNVPVKADNLTIYMAFCRAKSSGFARGLLNLFSDTASVLAGPVVGAVAKQGVDLTKRLAGLLGADGVETRFGIMSGNALVRSGYYVHAGVPASDLSVEELEIHDGQLVLRDGSQAIQTIDNADYLVLALEHRSTIVTPDYGLMSTLPFHTRFISAREKVLLEDEAGSKAEMAKLRIEIAASPDLIEADRIGAIIAYQAGLAEWKNVKGNSSLMGPSESPRARLLEMANKSEGRVADIILLASRALGVKGPNKPAEYIGTLGDRAKEKKLRERNQLDAKLLGSNAEWLVKRLNSDKYPNELMATAVRTIITSLYD